MKMGIVILSCYDETCFQGGQSPAQQIHSLLSLPNDNHDKGGGPKNCPFWLSFIVDEDLLMMRT